MKFTPQRHYVKYENTGEEQKFDVKVNAKLIAILSDGIYSDKVLAVIRELSANARDSHIENGNLSAPFDIKLPTTFDCQFSIRDYGVGLSPERIREVYCTYGASTKDDNNNYTGMLGIGSKVPFCYNSKTCTIESFCDGTHTIYSAHIGPDGLPTLVKMTETPSTEPSGVKIVIPVAQGDIHNFIVAAQNIFTWFTPKPKFIGSQPTIPKIEILLKGDSDWELRKTDYNVHAGAVAIMGAMNYPISFQDTNLTQEQQAVLNAPITLYFKLGDLDVAASRESLSYDARTRLNIIARLTKIIQELNIKVEIEIAKCGTLFEARKKVGEVLGRLPHKSTKLCSIRPIKI
jgi:hypothetical protein